MSGPSCAVRRLGHRQGARGWTAPLYWRRGDLGNADASTPWSRFGLMGPRPVSHAEPVCHESLRGRCVRALRSGARLPTEFEWEHACRQRQRLGGGRATSHRLAAVPDGRPERRFGAAVARRRVAVDRQPIAYPGFRPAPGAVGEYNGKFMSNQMVLRGGVVSPPRATPRATYRNSSRRVHGGRSVGLSGGRRMSGPSGSLITETNHLGPDDIRAAPR